MRRANTMKKIVFLLLSFLLTSCGIMLNSSTDSDISSDRTYLSVEIFQTLSKTEALAWTRNYKIVKLETDTEIFYDGKQVAGDHKLTGTYSYTNKEGTIKTVPVYTRTHKIADEHGNSAYLSVEIIQTFSKNEALAWTKDYDIVKIETTSEVYYDGKSIAGAFCLAGTYTYTTKDGRLKTVPVYIRDREYKTLMNQ